MTAIGFLVSAVTPDPWWINVLQGVGLFLFFALMLASLASVIVGLPGLWIIVVEAIVFALVTDFARGIGWWDLIGLLALAGAAELLEYLLTMRGAEKSGGSRAAGWWAIAGGIVGAIALSWAAPIIGSLLGAFIGVFAGAFLYAWHTERDFDRAMAVGFGAFKGRLGAVLVKEVCGAAMVGLIIWQVVRG